VVAAVPECVGHLPYVELDPKFYKLLDDFERRFPGGAPSLCAAERLVVHGDVTFGEGVRVHGAVELDVDKPLLIDAGTTLEP
jgi:UTP--glucose-1-phosphate uridylyltransferase